MKIYNVSIRQDKVCVQDLEVKKNIIADTRKCY